MKFKTRVREVEAVRWDGSVKGFWNGPDGKGVRLSCEPGKMTWLAEAVNKPRDEVGAAWAEGGATMFINGYGNGNYYIPVEPGMWLVWSCGHINVHDQETFDLMFEPV